ncbi:MAG: transcription antitermination factor NusB [Thermoguttaceae bacterium]|nr:transcription antitermination factor NusB [Thermoguttaceae bacterium]
MNSDAKKSGFRGRSFARIVAFQIICEHDVNPGQLNSLDLDYIRARFSDLEGGRGAEGEDALLTDSEAPKGKISRDDVAQWSDFTRKLILAVLENRDRIDRRLETASDNWRIGRMSLTDRNILRMAVAEIDLGTPEAVVINEAIELGKKFGRDAESPKFINGILGKVVRETGPPADEPAGGDAEA